MKQLDKKDILWVFTVSTLILLWGSIPTWAGYQAETEDIRFRGIYFDSQDYAVHISMMEAGKHGELAYQFRFTTEAHNPAYLRLFYVALGHISRILELPTQTTFQLARWILGYLALLTLYKLSRRIFPDPFWSRTGFLLATLGSGLGWLQLIFNWAPGPITPIDFWLIDCYVFFSLSLFPHFAFVSAGMCLMLNLWLGYLDAPNWPSVLWISVIAILVQFVNPIALAIVDAGLVGATLASWWRQGKSRRMDITSLAILAIVQMPLLVYNFSILERDPLWSQFTAQNLTLSPPPVYYILGFAPFLPFVIFGLIEAIQNRSSGAIASFSWVITGFTLAYAPLFIQRRFLQNITIPLAFLAVHGLIKLFGTGPAQIPGVKRWQPILVTLYVFAASISSIQLSLGRMAYLQTHPPDMYYPAGLDDAVSWLNKNGQYNDFALAAEMTSQILTQKTGMRVYFGHEMETLHHGDKENNVQLFFEGNMDELASHPIKWVVYGPYEQRINPSFQAGTNLELVYDEEDLKIYRVK